MTESADGSTVRAVSRAIDILFALGHSPLTLGDVAEVVSLSKPTTYRLLSTLRAKGMVVQDQASGHYGLGPGCFHLMSSISNGNAGFIFEATDALEELRDVTAETVAVHVRAGRSRICVKELPSPHLIRYIAGVGVSEGIHTGSAGKTLLAFMPETERERLLKDLPLAPTTPNTITDLDTLRAELTRIAEAGVAYSHGERAVGAVGVTAPITDANGFALAALSVIGPEGRLGEEKIAEVERQVREVAARISATVSGASEVD
ncbi:IclR family transcriptional regulator [Amycolatopsis sp. WGS_07]|uniref:IclR family transcriptional regulator n=1 Tax=Amycolatopsis sp. WGS_07 TaxID=3076764 RepID=UPI00387378B9